MSGLSLEGVTCLMNGDGSFLSPPKSSFANKVGELSMVSPLDFPTNYYEVVAAAAAKASMAALAVENLCSHGKSWPRFRFVILLYYYCIYDSKSPDKLRHVNDKLVVP